MSALGMGQTRDKKSTVFANAEMECVFFLDCFVYIRWWPLEMPSNSDFLGPLLQIERRRREWKDAGKDGGKDAGKDEGG